MTAPTLFVANFDCDDRLARPSLGTLPKRLRELNARLAPVLRRLCEPGDAVACVGDGVPDAGRFGRVEPWGVEPHALRWLRSLGLGPDTLDRLPDPAVVRAVNGRRWQFAAETDLGVLPAGARLCESIEQVAAACAALPASWVLKSEHGASGRGVRFGAGNVPDRLLRWAKNALARGGCVTVEPRAADTWEGSAHFTLADGGVRYDGVCRLHCTPGGRFRSVEPLPTLGDGLHSALPIWEAVTQRAHAAGYRGPLGIDAAGSFGVVNRPVRDVNARWTMGRVALESGRIVTGL